MLRGENVGKWKAGCHSCTSYSPLFHLITFCFFFHLREGVLSNCLFLQRAYLYCHKWQRWFSQSMYASMAEASSHNIVAIITILQQKCLIACKHNTWQNYKYWQYFQNNHVRLHNCATSNFLPMLWQICSYIFMPHYPLYRWWETLSGVWPKEAAPIVRNLDNYYLWRCLEYSNDLRILHSYTVRANPYTIKKELSF